MSHKHDIKEAIDLACLKFDEDQQENFQVQFDKILEYFNVLSELDTEGIEPLLTPHEQSSPLREDCVKPDLSVEEVLQNAPDVKDGLFKVPPVV